MYLSVTEVSKKWNISDRRIRKLCLDGKIIGAYQDGKNWKIPIDAKKPLDGRFKQDKKILSNLHLKLNEFKNLRRLSKGEIDRINNDFIIEYIYNSNALDGSILTLSDTALILKGLNLNNISFKDKNDILNHKMAFEYILSICDENKFLDEEIIKKIHTYILANNDEDKGKYRRLPVNMLASINKPISPNLIEKKLNEMIYNYLESDESFIDKLSRFHLEFESIQAFIDGNSKTGRLIINLELAKKNFPFINFKFEDKYEYYNAFEKYYKNGSISEMSNLLEKYIIERINWYIEILNH